MTWQEHRANLQSLSCCSLCVTVLNQVQSKFLSWSRHASNFMLSLQNFRAGMAGTLIQYVVVRKDLIGALQWPVGAVIAQACHACSAVMFTYHDDPVTQQYTADLDNMHKCVLEVS